MRFVQFLFFKHTLERDYDKLMSFYEHGYALMKKEYANLLRYMEE